MPNVEVPNFGVVEFPDDMPEEAINAAIAQNFRFDTPSPIASGFSPTEKLPAGTPMSIPIEGPADLPIMDQGIPAGFNPATGLPYKPDEWGEVITKTGEQFLPRSRASLMAMMGLAKERRGLEVSGRPTDPAESIAQSILGIFGRDRPLMVSEEAWKARRQAGEKIIEGAKPYYELGETYMREAQAKAPEVLPGSGKEFVSELGSTVADMTVPVLMGILTRGAGTIPATTVGVTGMTPTVAGQQALRDKDLTPEQRQMRAGLYTLAEEIPEMVPMGFLLGKGKGLFKRVIETTVGEGVQEELTNVLQAAIDKGTIDPNMTWGEVLKSGLDPKTFLLGAAAGGTLAAATHPVQKAQEMAERKEAQRQFNEGWIRFLQENQQAGPLFKAVQKPKAEPVEAPSAREQIMKAFETRDQQEAAQKAAEEEKIASEGVRARIMDSLRAQQTEREIGGEKVAPRTAMEEAFRRTVEKQPVTVEHVDRGTKTGLVKKEAIPSGTNVPLREIQASFWTEKLPGLSRRQYEKLAQISPPEPGTTQEKQLQEIRARISAKGETTETAMRAVWGPELANAPRELRSAITSDVALSETSFGIAQQQVEPSGIKTDLPTGLNIEPAPEGSLSPEEREIETRFAEKIKADPEAAMERYKRLRGTEGGKIINTDLFRELSDDYSATKESRARLSSAVHEPASALTKAYYRQQLAEPPVQGQVVFTAGGSGAGKSAGIHEVQEVKEKSDIIYDTNMNTFSSAKDKIDMALDSGRRVTIVYTARDPVVAMTEGVLKRAENPKSLSYGRTVPIKEIVRTHVGAAETIKKLREHYANDARIDFIYVDNTGGKEDVKLSDETLPDKLNFDNLESRLNEALDNAYREGKITEETYRGTKGTTGEIARGESTVPGDRRGDSEESQAQYRPGAVTVSAAPPAWVAQNTLDSQYDPFPADVTVPEDEVTRLRHRSVDIEDTDKYRLLRREWTRSISRLYYEHFPIVARALRMLHDAGLPKSSLLTVDGVIGHQNVNDTFSMVHWGIPINVGNNSIIGITHDVLEYVRQNPTDKRGQFAMLAMLAHEIGHSVDIRQNFANSVASPLFDLEIQRSPNTSSGYDVRIGPVLNELMMAHGKNSMGLSNYLAYPMAWIKEYADTPVGDVQKRTNMETFIKKESFAQLYSLYYTVGQTTSGRESLMKVMPQAMKFMDEVHHATATVHTVAERDRGVRQAFQVDSPVGGEMERPRMAAREGTAGTQDRGAGEGVRGVRDAEAGRGVFRPVVETPGTTEDNARHARDTREAERAGPARVLPGQAGGTAGEAAPDLSRHPGRETDRGIERAGLTFTSAKAEDFHQAITEAKEASRFGSSVAVYSKAEYAKMQTFLLPDKSAGFALKGDDLVSVFSNGTHPGIASDILDQAIAKGARRLDAFDTRLPGIYSTKGFKAVARIKWNDEFAPADWNKYTYRAFNNGKPDVVFMVYDPNAPLYKPGDGKLVETYDEAVRLQDEALQGKIDIAATGLAPPRPPVTPPIPPSPDSPKRRSAMSIYDKKVGKPPKPFLEIFNEWTTGRRLEHEFFDSGIPFKLMVEKVAPDIGPQDNPYIGWKLLAGDSAIIEDWLGINPGTEGGAPFRLGDRLKVENYGKSLREILAPVAHDIETLKEFEAYLIGRRANELYERKKEHLFTRKEIDELLALETPAFKKVAKEVYAYNDRLLQYAVDGGFLDPKVAEKFREYVNYIPFYREAEYEGDVGGPRQGSLYHRLKGGKQNLRSPLQNLIDNTAMVIHAVNRNAVLNNALDMTKAFPGAKAWMEQVPLPTQVLKLSTERIMKQLVDQGVYLNPDTADDLAVMQTFFMKKPLGDEKNRIIIMKRNGKTIAVKIHDPMLWRTLHAFTPTELGLITDILAVPAEVLRTGVVMSPEFMARNFLRDTLSAYIQSGKKFVPVVDSLKGFVHVARASETYRLYRALGGAYADFWHGDSKEAAVSLRRLAKLSLFPESRLLNPAGWWRTLKKVGSITEAGTRTRTLEKYLDGTIEGALQGAVEAREVSVDFGMHGVNQTMRILERLTPFLNPAKQGLYKMSRTFGNHPMTTLLRGAPIVLLTFALWMLNRDKKWYKDLEDWEKDMYWHFDVGLRTDKGKVIPLRLPKPFEYGAVFGSFWEAGLESMYKKNPEELKRVYGTVENVFGLRLIPTVASVPLELWSNKSLFTERRIVPEGMETLEPYLQYGAGTSNVSKAVGQAFNASPYKIDHTVRNVFGTLGVYATALMDHPLGNALGYPSKPAIRPPQWPLLKVFVSDPDRAGNKAVTEFYELLQEARTRYASWSYLQYDFDYLDKQAEKSGDLLFLKDTAENAAHVIAELRKSNRMIRDDMTLTPEQKRILIDENGEQIKQIAETYRDLLKGAKR